MHIRCCCPTESAVAGRLSRSRSSCTRSRYSPGSQSSWRRRGPYDTLSATVPAIKAGVWKTIPTRRLSSRTSKDEMSVPNRLICPAVGSSSLFIIRRRVDLPDPEGPIRARISPLGTLNETSWIT